MYYHVEEEEEYLRLLRSLSERTIIISYVRGGGKVEPTHVSICKRSV